MSKLLLCWLFLTAALSVQASDTLSVSREAADSLFLNRNYTLLAQRYQIKSDRALIRQAKQWDNPSFSAELSMNSIRRPALNIGAGGQVAYELTQVIKIAGQRNKQVRLAQLNADYSEAAFADLMRTLRWLLHNSFYSLYFKRNTLAVLEEQKRLLQNIVAAYQQADANGSVSHADYIRLRALLFSLNNDYLNTTKEVLKEQETLQQLLGTTATILPVMEGEDTPHFPPVNYSLAALIDTALAERPDMRMSVINKDKAQANHALQQAMAVPDLHLGGVYDKADGFVPHYLGITLGIDLPLWNRNRGNIRSAAFQMEQQEVYEQQQRNTVITEVTGAYQQLQNYQHNFDKKDLSRFDRSYKTLIGNVAGNFTKGNISLLQFIDFFNSYSDHISDVNEYYESLFHAYETLAYAVGVPLSNLNRLE